ncbi:maleylpyruvate isomerase family mycothiol-dependent enzyme [Actinocatenispora rupis]|uniref:TIGR03083 family protein n=1 Tax=Actinocatenispora rupis TaxID=519421 RepID=A0A8J3NC81_9ACTN|nr:maleylpyruvate isomerase family mycothiol-dependent enzyme [Actinocatenispora rupis]GID13791.1 hypothetical protein Aru02nite_46800 [Actinocatenispora rupis]
METSRFRECLAADAARLRAVAAGRLDAAVPSCPGWTVQDLVRHVAQVYLHKVRCMELGRAPEDWPPDHSRVEPLALFDGALAELTAAFDARSTTDPTFTWYGPDQTVGFWLRRMAQETAVHRVDAELAAGAVTPVADDLALDGIDEVLRIFLGWGTREYVHVPEVAALLAEADGRAVEVRSGAVSFLLRPGPDGVAVSDGGGSAAATVSGDPSPLLLWLWNRADADAVRTAGDPALVGYLRRLMADATE